MAVVEDDQAGAHRSRAPPRQPAHLDLLDDDREAQSVIERVGDPALTLGDVAEVNSSMAVSDRAPVLRMIEFAPELECLSRLDESIDVAPAIHASRRRTPEFVDAAWVGAYPRLFEQRQRIGAALPLAILFRHEPRVHQRAYQETMERGDRDKRPGEQRAPEAIQPHGAICRPLTWATAAGSTASNSNIQIGKGRSSQLNMSSSVIGCSRHPSATIRT